ncbi:MAG: hypothetical protein KBF26_04735, partial [Opitutaceae bacterium]|nr:hypothetical protein [Opitutaceae bacterium]
AFAWLRFSENTVDNDLWGHVLYGQRVLALGQLEKTDTLSWTAAGQPWINHETGAEIVLGAVHHAAGGTGLWLLMIGLAALTVGLALRAGIQAGARFAVGLGLFAASINFIATGYAVRPQLFTMLALVLLIPALRRFFNGRLLEGLTIPALFAIWINFHGGWLAGWLILLLAAGLETLARLSPQLPRRLRCAAISPAPPGSVALVALVAASSTALLLNPYGWHLFTWTLGSVQLPRPDITEWQPLLPSPASAPFYLVLLISLLAWLFTRRPRQLWEAAVLLMLTTMAVLHQRHAPLFGLVNLMLTPPHLADLLHRLAPHCHGLRQLFARTAMRIGAAVAAVIAGLFCLQQSVRAPRAHPFTLEVPRAIYPVAAIGFMREHKLTGHTLTFFDWGQQVLWELPHNPVSFDGRLDTVYPPAVMTAHWRLYAGQGIDPALRLDEAAVALLPTGSPGVSLLRQAGWQPVYHDPLATVLRKDRASDSTLPPLTRPAEGGPAATSGRTPFPENLPALASALKR